MRLILTSLSGRMTKNRTRHQQFCCYYKSHTGSLIYRLHHNEVQSVCAVCLCENCRPGNHTEALMELFKDQIKMIAMWPMCFCTIKWTPYTGQVLSDKCFLALLIEFQCGFSVNLLAWRHLTQLLFVTISLYPLTFELFGQGRPQPHLSAYKTKLASSDWSKVRSEGLMQHWDGDTAKQGSVFRGNFNPPAFC